MEQLSPEGGKRVLFESGAQLFAEGDTSRDLYIIVSGMVVIFKTEGGIEVELDRIGPGEVLGEIAAIDAGPRSASAKALEKTTAVLISSANLEKINSGIPDWFAKIARILAQRLREADKKIDNSLSIDKCKSVAACLQLMLVPSDYTTPLPVKSLQNTCMDILCIAPALIESALVQLEKSSIIKIDKGEITVTNISLLTTLTAEILAPQQHCVET